MNFPTKRTPFVKKSDSFDYSSHLKKGKYLRFDNIKNAFIIKQVREDSILVSPISSRSLEYVFFTKGQGAGIIILKELESTLYSESGLDKSNFRITGIRKVLKCKPKY